MRWPVGAALLVLAACVTTPPASKRTLDAAQQHSLLQELTTFSLTGRVAVAAAGQGSTPSVEWRQQRDVSRVKLSGPLGVGSLQLEYSAESLRLVTANGDVLVDDEAQRVLTRELGFVPPFEALRYWILGEPAPADTAAIETRDAAGLLQKLEQQQWLILYERYMPVNTSAGTAQMPARLTATRAGLRLRLVVDRWRLQ
ncbi:MAG: lipoprotein insertase outer membrane protein LolB [Steroidobacteraceae bacterium]